MSVVKWPVIRLKEVNPDEAFASIALQRATAYAKLTTCPLCVVASHVCYLWLVGTHIKTPSSQPKNPRIKTMQMAIFHSSGAIGVNNTGNPRAVHNSLSILFLYSRNARRR